MGHKNVPNIVSLSHCLEQLLEDVDHFVFHCGKYTTERNRLEWTVEDILWREGCNDVTCIDLKLNGGYNKNAKIDKQQQQKNYFTAFQQLFM